VFFSECSVCCLTQWSSQTVLQIAVVSSTSDPFLTPFCTLTYIIYIRYGGRNLPAVEQSFLQGAVNTDWQCVVFSCAWLTLSSTAEFNRVIDQEFVGQMKFRVTTCLENLDMSENLTAVGEMSAILLKVGKCRNCQGKNLVREKLPKTVYCLLFKTI